MDHVVVVWWTCRSTIELKVGHCDRMPLGGLPLSIYYRIESVRQQMWHGRDLRSRSTIELKVILLTFSLSLGSPSRRSTIELKGLCENEGII